MLKFWKGKRMTFKQAKNELEKIADGKYHTLRYEITETQFGNLIQCCEVYIEGLTWYNGETWGIALDKLKRAIKPLPVKIDVIPEIDVK